MYDRLYIRKTKKTLILFRIATHTHTRTLNFFFVFVFGITIVTTKKKQALSSTHLYGRHLVLEWAKKGMYTAVHNEGKKQEKKR